MDISWLRCILMGVVLLGVSACFSNSKPKITAEEKEKVINQGLNALASVPQNACRNGFVYIPAGPFIMGSDKDAWDEGPAQIVTTDAYCIAQHETTNVDVIDTIARISPSVSEAEIEKLPHVGIYEFNGGPNKPAGAVGWEEANAYCQVIGGRLPTEAEWEKAARGPRGFEYGTKSGNLSPEEAVYGSFLRTKITDVCSYPPNEYGLCDMTGNVGEWVDNWYSFSAYKKMASQNPTGPESGFCKVTRGANSNDCPNHGILCDWLSPGKYKNLRATARCANRISFDGHQISYTSVGFRCVIPLQGSLK